MKLKKDFSWVMGSWDIKYIKFGIKFVCILSFKWAAWKMNKFKWNIVVKLCRIYLYEGVVVLVEWDIITSFWQNCLTSLLTMFSLCKNGIISPAWRMGKWEEVIFSWLQPEFAHESTQWYCHLDIVHLKILLFWLPFSLQTLFCDSWDWKCTESKSLWKLNLYQHCLQTLFEFKPILYIFTIFTKIKEELVS